MEQCPYSKKVRNSRMKILIVDSKGFISTVQGLRDTIPAVYDFTIVYNDGKKPPSLPDLALGRGGM